MRRIGPKGLALIKKFEGCKLTPYRCPSGILTVGFGSTGPHVIAGKSITQAEADALLLADLSRFESGVVALLGGRETAPGQFSALVSFAFNVGLFALSGSTLLRKHMAGDYAGAADQFLKWDKARVNGVLKSLPGLTKRREAERELYLS